jgi:hypothetical protein
LSSHLLVLLTEVQQYDRSRPHEEAVMRRVLAVALSAVAVLGLLAPDASAQAPTTKVTISGLIDNVTSYSSNMSINDLNLGRVGDDEWYARTRARPDITAEIGTTKFVLGLEIDYTWGQTGGADTSPVGSVGTGPQHFGTTSGADLNTDMLGNIEMKWAYTEFGLPGIPWASRVRLGAQPWAVTYKLASLATGDFGGAHLTTTITPIVKLNLTYGQVEEEATGTRDGFLRGEDWAFIGSLEITPFKGLDIRPIYSYFTADGTTSGGQARLGRGGVSNSAAFFPSNSQQEHRHTVGIDARWRGGPFSLEPTFFYQFGTRDLASGFGAGEQDLNAFFADIRGGWQTGPLLIEGAVIYTTGNKASEDVRNPREDVNFYQPISTDSSYYAAWNEHFALNIDYFYMMQYAGSGLAPGVAIGYDKYGMFRLGARASYNVTPAFTVRGAVSASWTAQEVDTSGIKSAAAGITTGDGEGDDRYLGTEVDLGFQWRFAPGLALDLVGAYTFAGQALDASRALNTNTGVLKHHGEAGDIMSVTARVRYTF